MKAEDKSKSVPLTVKVHPKVLTAAQELSAWLNDSSLDHVVSEAILDAAKDRDFLKWKEAKEAKSAAVKEVPKPGKVA